MKCVRCGKEHTVLMYMERDGWSAHLCGKCVYALRHPSEKYPHNEIKRLYEAGFTKRELAERFNTYELTILHIIEEENDDV